MKNKEKLTDLLNHNSLLVKKFALKELVKLEKTNQELVPAVKEIAPLHFSSFKSYSLYSPTMCAYIGYRSGAFAVGICDYATLSYSQEFKKACNILKIPYACGYRVDGNAIFDGEDKTVLYGLGIPVEFEPYYTELFKKVNDKKTNNTLALIDKINADLQGQGITVDVKELKKEAKKQKTIFTEKHVAKNLAENIVNTFGKGKGLLEFIDKYMGIVSCEGETRFLHESENMYFTEDLAKVIYNNYLKPKLSKEDNDLKEFIRLNEELGVISSCGIEIKKYDEEELTKIIKVLRKNGFNSVTIRNKLLSEEEYLKIVNFFSENEMLAISMYSLGLPRQHVPTSSLDVDFKSSLAIIGNSVSIAYDKKDGLFTNRTISKCPNFEKRLVLFANIGKRER